MVNPLPEVNTLPSPVPAVTITLKSSASLASLHTRPAPASILTLPPLTDCAVTLFLKKPAGF